MTRERLRRTLAFASMEILWKNTISKANIKRYVLPELHRYRINREEKITNKDVRIAIELVATKIAESQKPMEFRFGRGDVWTTKRRKAFMSDDLPCE